MKRTAGREAAAPQTARTIRCSALGQWSMLDAVRRWTWRNSTSFTIFEGTSEIQRMIIGRALTGLDVR